MGNRIEALEKNTSRKNINVVDPDAPIMKGKKGEFNTFYNVQVSCNESQIINYVNVVVEGNDKQQLVPALEGTKSNTGDEIEIALADADYGTYDSLEFMAKEGICGYVPYRDMKTKYEDKPYHSSHFEYDKETDTYSCPTGQQLTYYQNKRDKTRKTEHRLYRTDACKQCPIKELCCPKSKTKRTIQRELRQDLKDKMKSRLNSPAGKAMYNRRMHPVESIFGHFKHNLGYTQFLLRGLEKVKAEFIIMCLSYNLMKLSKHHKKQLKSINIRDFYRQINRRASHTAKLLSMIFDFKSRPVYYTYKNSNMSTQILFSVSLYGYAVIFYFV